MYLDRYLRLISGSLVLLSVALGYFVNPLWLALAALAGAGLVLGGATGWCPMVSVLRAANVPEQPACCSQKK